MAKNRDFSFKGKVSHNAEKKDREMSFSYLVMPKDIEVYVPDPGTMLLDIIPYFVTDENHPDRDEEYKEALVDDPWYKRPFKIHRSIGPDGDTVVCLSSVGKKCPICEYRSKLKMEIGNKPTDQEKKDLEALRPKDRALYYVVPMDTRNFDEDFHIMDISYHLFQKLLSIEAKEDRDNDEFLHPEEGKSLEIRWDKDSWDNQKFCRAGKINFVKRDHDGYTWDEVEDLPTLDDIILSSVASYKEIQKLFMNVDDEDYSNEEMADPDKSEEEPTRTRRRSSSRQTSSKEEDPPKRTRTRKPRE